MLYVIVKVFFKYADQEKKEFKKISVQNENTGCY
jgi:hypothetical protein